MYYSSEEWNFQDNFQSRPRSCAVSTAANRNWNFSSTINFYITVMRDLLPASGILLIEIQKIVHLYDFCHWREVERHFNENGRSTNKPYRGDWNRYPPRARYNKRSTWDRNRKMFFPRTIILRTNHVIELGLNDVWKLMNQIGQYFFRCPGCV